MDQLTFYSRTGTPVAYSQDGTHIYLFNGEPVGYFASESIYSYSGKHLGRFQDGWVRDNQGRCVFFTPSTMGSGPVKRVKKVKPVKSVKRVKPAKSVKQVKPVKPVNSLSWSELSSESFFSQ